MQLFIIWFLVQLLEIKRLQSSDLVGYCILGESINLTCPVNGNSSTPYSWSREKDNVYIFDRELLEPSIMNGEKYRIFNPNVLQISAVTERDEGTYACYTTRNFFSIELKLIIPISGLKILPRPDYPYIYEQNENVITATSNESLTVRCTVSRSRPRPHFYVHVENRGTKTLFESLPHKYKASPTADGGYITEAWFNTKYVGIEDNGRPLVCVADLNIGSLKPVETSVKLNVLFPPVCAKPRLFFLGLKRPGNISCTVLRANPDRLKFEWPSLESMIIRNHFQVGLTSYLTVRPTKMEHIRNMTCVVSNGIHSPVVCPLSLKLGASPDPVSDCKWIYHTNTTIQITCKLGFDQGDPDQQCVMYRFDADRNDMIEYARSRLCSFVIDHTTLSEYHKLQIFSINKYGSNIEDAVILEINRVNPPPLPSKKYTVILIVAGACGIMILLIICCCLYGHSSNKIVYKKQYVRDVSKRCEDESSLSLFHSVQSKSSDCIPNDKRSAYETSAYGNHVLMNGYTSSNGNLQSVMPFHESHHSSDTMLLSGQSPAPPPFKTRSSITKKTNTPQVEIPPDSRTKPKPAPRHSYMRSSMKPDGSGLGNSKITEC